MYYYNPVTFKVGDAVSVCNTTDPELDKKNALVKGFFGDRENPLGIIIELEIPGTYDPCIVLTPHCIKKV
jgi:hypothetical protein